MRLACRGSPNQFELRGLEEAPVDVGDWGLFLVLTLRRRCLSGHFCPAGELTLEECFDEVSANAHASPVGLHLVSRTVSTPGISTQGKNGRLQREERPV